jgi:hypothetical protein
VGTASTDERSATREAGILDPVPCRRRRAGWAWLAGGDGFVLATVPSEASFLSGLGMWVAGMALISGFAMTVAASQWWSTSERAAVLTHRIALEARAQEDADELGIRGEVTRHPEGRSPSRHAVPLSEHG